MASSGLPWVQATVYVVLLATALLPPAGCSRELQQGASAGRGGARSLLGTWGTPTPPHSPVPCPHTAIPTNTPIVRWVNPAYTGSVTNGQQATPYKTFAAAWAELPKYQKLTSGWLINLLPGTSLVDRLWMEGVWGTADAPVVIQQPADLSATPSRLEIIDLFNCSYIYFSRITFESSTTDNVVHFAGSDYMFLLNVTIRGRYSTDWSGTAQALKVNQVKGLYIEDCDISGSSADGVGLDAVATQYGHICRSAVHHADWCFYLKGGSGYFLIDSNTVHTCSQAGLEMGQGTGFEYMVAPWIEYETYGMRVINNVIHDVWGAGLGVNGGYQILMAHNSLYKVGSRSHTVEFLYGSRSCDESAPQCTARYALGGWGPRVVGAPAISIPSKDILFLNNLVVNPLSMPSAWSQFATQGAINTAGQGYPNSLANTVISASNGLVVAGNVFVNFKMNGAVDTMDLGLDACSNTGSRCDQPFVAANNLMNKPGLAITFADAAALTLTEASKAAILASWTHAPESAFTFPAWSTAPVDTPAGTSDYAVLFDQNGVARAAGSDLPGAVLGGSGTGAPPPPVTCPSTVCPANIGRPASNGTCKAAPGEECPVPTTIGAARACAGCARGFYSAGGIASMPYPACAACPANKTTGTTCATSAANCSVTICRPGTAGALCSPCSMGSYSLGGSATAPQAECVACPPGTNTSATGADGPAKCVAPPCKPGYGNNGTMACAPCARGFWSAGGTVATPNPPCTACPATTTTYAKLGLATSSLFCFSADTPWATINTTPALTGITLAAGALSAPSIILPSTAGWYSFSPPASVCRLFVWAGSASTSQTGVAAALKAAVVVPGASAGGHVQLGSLLSLVPVGTANTFDPNGGATYRQYAFGFRFAFTSAGSNFVVVGSSPALASNGLPVTDVTALGQRAWTARVQRVTSGASTWLTSSGQWIAEVTAPPAGGVGSVARVLYTNFAVSTSIPLALPALGPV